MDPQPSRIPGPLLHSGSQTVAMTPSWSPFRVTGHSSKAPVPPSQVNALARNLSELVQVVNRDRTAATTWIRVWHVGGRRQVVRWLVSLSRRDGLHCDRSTTAASRCFIASETCCESANTDMRISEEISAYRRTCYHFTHRYATASRQTTCCGTRDRRTR